MAFFKPPAGALVKNGEIAAYSAAGVGQNICYALVTGYLMYFYINVFHIDPRAVGLMLFIEGIWDIINNPLCGMVIDRTRTKWGKMLPFLRGGTAPLAVFTVLLFAGPYIIKDPSPLSPAKIAYMFLTYFVWELFYSITDVAYWGLSAAISPLESDRRRVMTAVNAAVSVGAALPAFTVPLLLDYSAAHSEKISASALFLLLGLATGIGGIGLFSLSGFCVKERVMQSQEGAHFRESIRELSRNRGLRIIVVSGLIRSLAGVSGVFMTYYFIDVLGFAGFSVLAQLPSVLTWALSYALLPAIRRRFPARTIALGSNLLYGGIWLIAFLIGLKYYSRAAVMIPVLMVGTAGMGLINAPSEIVLNEMLADASDYTEWKTGKRSEGISFSLRITTVKIGGTVVQAAASGLLWLIGYVTAPDSARVPQSDAVQFRIFVILTLVPAVMYVLSAVPYFFYDLTGEKRQRMRDELEARRKSTEQN